MTASSSQSTSGLATGKPTLWSAEMTRYSRSTACAEGKSLPGGLRRSTYFLPSAALRRYVGFDCPPLNCSMAGMRKPRSRSSAPTSIRCRSSTGLVPMNCSNMDSSLPYGIRGQDRNSIATRRRNSGPDPEFRSSFHLQPEGDRPVVHQADLHVRAEATGLHRARVRRGGDEEIEEAPAFVGRGGAREARPQATRGIGGERELRDGEQLAVHILEREVHLAGRIGKDAVGEHALGKAARRIVGIAALHRDEREEAFADRRDFLLVHAHGGVGDPLDQRDQAMMSGISRARSFWIWSLRTSLRFFRRCSCSWSCLGSAARRLMTSSRSWCSISRA